MSTSSTPLDRLLRWYPAPWRDRYGEELVALMSDDLNGRRPTLGYRRRVALAGMRERAIGAGVMGHSASPAERRRTGSLIVLGAWFVMVLAGASFAKTSEHFARALPVGSRGVPRTAYDLVVALGVAGAALVVIGSFAAAPTLTRFLRDGGWASLRRHVWRGVVLSVVAVGSLAALAAWAHHLSPAQRNGTDAGYFGAFVLFALLVAATLGQWTLGAMVAARRMNFTERLLRLETSLAVGVGAIVVAIAVSASVWWSTMAQNAPWFLTGALVGAPASVVTSNFVVTMGLMALAVVASGFGVARVIGARTPRSPLTR